jgi:hypothetical protein
MSAIAMLRQLASGGCILTLVARSETTASLVWLLWLLGVLPVIALSGFLKKLWRTWRGNKLQSQSAVDEWLYFNSDVTPN